MPGPLLPILAAASSLTSIGSSIAGLFGANRQAARLRREGNAMASDALARGEEEALAYGRNLSRFQGAQNLAVASQGLVGDFGTAAEIARQTASYGAQDVGTIRRNAAREARALRQGMFNQASALRSQGTQFGLQAIGSLLHGELNAQTLGGPGPTGLVLEPFRWGWDAFRRARGAAMPGSPDLPDGAYYPNREG